VRLSTFARCFTDLFDPGGVDPIKKYMEASP
jgi:hypothetical protein